MNLTPPTDILDTAMLWAAPWENLTRLASFLGIDIPVLNDPWTNRCIIIAALCRTIDVKFVPNDGGWT